MTAPVHPPVLEKPTAPLNGNDLSRVPATDLPELANGFNALRQAAAAASNGHITDPFKLNPEFAYTPQKVKVITIGSGFSGLLIAHKFQHRFPEIRDIVEHTIFEARSEVGWTWLENNYPGVQCDVPAHIYVSDFKALSRVVEL